MKLNNKGMTLVELIVTFALLLVIVVGLYNLILEVKFEVNDKKIIKELNEYSSIINNDIHFDLITAKPKIIIFKNSKQGNWNCNAISGTGIDCEFDGVEYIFTIGGLSDKHSPSDMDKNLCKDIFPCAIYYYTDNNQLRYRVIALNKGSDRNSNESLKLNGILYGGNEVGRAITPIYEPVPHDEYVEIRDIDIIDSDNDGNDTSFTSAEDDRMYIKIENDLFIINFPFYMVDNDKNYGFKIAYPFS